MELPALVAALAELRDARLVAIGIDDAPLPPFPDWLPQTGVVVAFARAGAADVARPVSG